MTTVSFYVKAGAETGYGHIVRCIALADELERRGCLCRFWGNDEALHRAMQGGYAACPDDGAMAGMWIVDLEGGCPPELAQRLRDQCNVLVILNGVGYPDGDPGRLLADIVVYQGVTKRPGELNWDGFEGSWYAGVEWLIIRPAFLVYRGSPVGHDPPHVIIAAGGSDPKDITHKLLDALNFEQVRLLAIIGPSNNRRYFHWLPRAELRRDPTNVEYDFASADVACVSYGMTAFECLALGIPTVALSISPDHAASAGLVQEQSGGALLSLGEVENVHPVDIRNAVEKQLADAPALSAKARSYVDGKGVYRVADKIMETLEAK